ncbi:hypothetical protein Q9L42_012725 [Methylomarinum sp. Ch1-1]|uniref:Uncharacterized protein n=1 Tax=Methylomarinum roseum TaxID=3067653 RepID=A0AAU7NQH4_9GAMM
MERCPCCNARLRSVSLCPRCRSDLSHAAAAERGARDYLFRAIRHCQENNAELGLQSLAHAQSLKKTPLAAALGDFLLDRQRREISQLLAQKQLLPAKKRLYKLAKIAPGDEQLRLLNDFVDYQLACR